MTLYDRIMSLKPIGHTSQISAIHFNNAKMRAAQLVTEADEMMSEMVQFVIDCDLSNNTDIREAHRILDKYNAYKEKSK